MKSNEIREKTLDDIENDLLAAEENLKTVRFQLVTSQLDNTSALKNARKKVALIKTIIRELELGIHKVEVSVKTADNNQEG